MVRYIKCSMTPRIAPLEPPFEEDVQRILTKMMPRQSPIPPLALFRVLARHPPLADAMQALGSYFLGKKANPAEALSSRDREVVIDRVCARCGCEYEWGVHAAVYGERVGLDGAQLAATVAPAGEGTALPERDRLLVALVDVLHDTSHVPDALWEKLAAHWTSTQLLELLVLSGWYHAIAYVANGARVPLESWAARFPTAAAG